MALISRALVYQNGQYDYVFINGRIQTWDILYSKVWHVVLCYGRLSSNDQPIRQKRGGFIGDIVNTIASFSKAWLFYAQNAITSTTLLNIQSAITTSLLGDPYIANLASLGNTVRVTVTRKTFTLSTLDIGVYIGDKTFNITL